MLKQMNRWSSEYFSEANRGFEFVREHYKQLTYFLDDFVPLLILAIVGCILAVFMFPFYLISMVVDGKEGGSK